MRAYVHVQRWGVNGEGLDPLINRIARNLLIDRHRRASPHLVSLDAAEEVHDPAPDLDEEVLRRQRNVEVRSAVSELPERHRTAIMYSLKGMSPAEVADKLGIGRNAADALLHRARRSLRERLRHVGEGMLGLGFWLGHKMRSGARRVGLDGHVPVAGIAVESSAAVVAAALIAATVGFGGGGSGGLIGSGNLRSTKAAIVSAAPERAVNVSAPVAGSPATGRTGGRGVTLGPASVKTGGGDDNGSYINSPEGNVNDPHNPDREILGVAPDVFEQQDSEAFNTACAAIDDCAALYEKPGRR